MKFSSLYELFPKTYYGNESEYQKFDGTDIINVDRVKDIPNDYFGKIGVPITFVDTYNSMILPFKIIQPLRGKINGKFKYMRYVIQRMTDEEWSDYVNMMSKVENCYPLEFKAENEMYEKLKDELVELYKPLGFDRTENVLDPMINWKEKRICHVEGVKNYPSAEKVLEVYKKYFEKYGLNINEFEIEFCNSGRKNKYYSFKQTEDNEMYKLITSEAVLPGHPDKVCDQIADAILDETIKRNKYCHNAVEVSIKNNKVFIFGETSEQFKNEEYINIAKNVLDDIGYDSKEFSFEVLIDKQSSEINGAVEDTNAGDQGIMFGYATNETDEFLPASIYYSNLLAKALFSQVKENSGLKPDGKVQVTARYKNGEFVDIATLLVSISHSKDLTLEQVQEKVHEIISASIPSKLINNAEILINPAGAWTNYGPKADSGTTGRKIVCDTYGGVGRVGGGCFSSKDPTKVDRSAAYYCRYVAKNLVAWGLCNKCEVGVSYAIGKSGPLSLEVNSFGTAKDDSELLKVINEKFNFTVKNIISELDLRRPIYRRTANFGHFGNNEYPWEQIKEAR